MRTTKHLTKAVVEATRLPAAGQVFIRDNAIPGFALRVLATGGKSFIWEGKINRRTARLTIGTWPEWTVALARAEAEAIRTARADGLDPRKERRAEKNQPTFGEVADAYMERHSRLHKKPRSIKDDEYYLAHYIPPAWKNRRLTDVTHEDVDRLKGTLKREHGPYCANHTVRFLRHMYNLAPDLADDWKSFHGYNPAQGVKLFTENKREKYLTPIELQKVNTALLAEEDWRWRAFFPLALLMGFRKAEICALRWVNVDFEQRTLRLPETKTGRSHLLPLPAPIVALLESLPSRDKSAWVFPSDSATGHIVEPAKAWQRIRERAGVEDVRLHDLRHTLASWLVAQGFSLPIIGRALNHRNTSTTERYSHLALDPIRAALELNASKMIGIAPGLADGAPK
jgi:integrase